MRRRRLPAALRPKLDRDERVIAWARAGGAAESVDGASGEEANAQPAAVVVTTRGVWLPGRAQRLGWHEVHKATWSGSRLVVVPATQVALGEGYVVMADGESVVVALADPDEVPAEIRKRVTRSVAYTAYHEMPGGGVRVVARRVAGVNGMVWHVRYDEGTDPADPDVLAITAELVAAASAPSELE